MRIASVSLGVNEDISFEMNAILVGHGNSLAPKRFVYGKRRRLRTANAWRSVPNASRHSFGDGHEVVWRGFDGGVR